MTRCSSCAENFEGPAYGWYKQPGDQPAMCLPCLRARLARGAAEFRQLLATDHAAGAHRYVSYSSCPGCIRAHQECERGLPGHPFGAGV
jgi:hypothetical protein